MSEFKSYWEKSRFIIVNEPIGPELTTRLMMEMSYLETQDKGKPIQLLINTPGGSITDGLTIIDYMRNKITSKIVGISTGMAASMGAILFLCCDERLMLPNSILMLHGIQVNTGGTIPFVNLQARNKYTELLNTKLTSIIKSRSNLLDAEIKEIMQTERYITAEEALERKMCDKIIVGTRERIGEL